MDDFELAKALFKQPKDTKSARVVSGTAYAASSDGTVQVDIDGSVMNLPTNVSVKEGDTVQVTISDRSPVVTGVIGRGDEMQAEIDAVADVSNYFWHDSLGAHVSNIDRDTSGNNVLIDADSVDIKDGNDVLATFTASTVELGKNSANSTIEMCAGNGSISYEQSPVYYGTKGNLVIEGSPTDDAEYVTLRTVDNSGNKGEVWADRTARNESEAGLYAFGYDANDPNATHEAGVTVFRDGYGSSVKVEGETVDLRGELTLAGSHGNEGYVLASGGAGYSPYWEDPSNLRPWFDLIYDTPLYWWDSGAITGTDSGSDDPSRAGMGYGELAASIEDYDLLVLHFKAGTTSAMTNTRLTHMVAVQDVTYKTASDIDSGTESQEFMYLYPAANPSWFIDVAYGFTDATHVYAKRRTYGNIRYWNIDKIYGIKF